VPVPAAEALPWESQASAAPVEEPEAPAGAEEPPSSEPSNILEQLLAAMEEETRPPGPEPFGDLGSARPREDAGPVEQHVVFTLAGTDYAVPIGNVLEIGRPHAVTPVPNAPEWVLGVANRRGDVISITDLRAFLGLDQPGPDSTGRMLVVRSLREDLTTGLVVDRVKEICKVPLERITLAASPIQDQVAPYLRGVSEHGGRLLVLLDCEQLLLSPEMRQFEAV
jgi:purine-binding chemotaxis protein CheW